MIVLYFAGVISLLFSILDIYPLFHDQNIILGIIFAFVSLGSFYSFARSADSKLESNRWTIIKTLYIFILTVIFESVGLWVYIEISSQWNELTILSPVFKALFTLFQIPFGWCKGNFYLMGAGDYAYTFTPNVSNFGMIYLVMLAFGLITLWFICNNHKQTLRYIFTAVISFFIFLFFRAIALVTFFLTQPVDNSNPEYYMTYFWHSLFAFISFIPWLLMMGIVFTRNGIETIKFSRIFNKELFKKYIISSVCLGCFILLLILTIFWIPSGKEKSGRILFEEYYSDWTKSTKAIDGNWYGEISTYNYYTLRKYISSFYDVTVNEQPLENVDLTQYDILILKVPTKPYSEKVIHQILSYVRNGGSLWVIGDHTNLFGSSLYLNRLIRHFGVRLRYDAVYHNETGKFNYLFTKTPLKHPIIQKVPVFLFATPCTLEVINPLIRTVISGETTKTYNISYSHKHFFPDTKPDLNTYYGSVTLLTAGNYGQGRVAVFTDSTVFSNFSIYLPGKTELALSILNWLNHRQLPGSKIVLFILTVTAFVMFLHYFKKIDNFNAGRNLVWPTIFGIIFFLMTVPLINFYNLTFYEFPEEKEPLIKIGFLDKYSSIYLPYAVKVNDEGNNYNTFYVWGQRVGLYNRYYFDLKKAVNESRAIFMILPKRKFEKADLMNLDEYLRNGGKLFLFDEGGENSSANQFLNQYGLVMQYCKIGVGTIISNLQPDLNFNNFHPIGFISGECIALYDWIPRYGKRQPVFVKKKVGKGELYVFGGINNFSNSVFGSDKIVPTGDKKQISDFMLEIYKLAAMNRE
jgi:hypothetical protein